MSSSPPNDQHLPPYLSRPLEASPVPFSLLRLSSSLRKVGTQLSRGPGPAGRQSPNLVSLSSTLPSFLPLSTFVRLVSTLKNTHLSNSASSLFLSPSVFPIFPHFHVAPLCIDAALVALASPNLLAVHHLQLGERLDSRLE